EIQFGGAMLSCRGRRWEGCTLARIAERIARRLRGERVEPGARVAIAVGEPALFLAAAGAVRALGGVAVLLSSRAARVAAREAHLVTEQLIDAQPQVVVADAAHRSALAGVLGRCSASVLVLDEDGEIAACEAADVT